MILRHPPKVLRRPQTVPASATIGPAPRSSQRPVRPGRVARGGAVATSAAASIWGDPFRLFLLALLIQTVSKIASFLGPLAKIRPAVILFSLCLLFALAQFNRVFNRDLLNWSVPRLVIAQLVVACLSALAGISLGHAAVFILNSYWKTLAFAFMLMTSLRDVTDVRRTVWATALACFILCFIGVFIMSVAKEGGGVDQYDPNDIGLIVVTSLPLAILAMQTSKGTPRMFALAGIVLLAATLVKTSSRGAFVGGACVGIALLVFLPGVSIVKRALSLGAIIATMIIFAPPGYWEAQKKVILDPKSDYNWDAVDGRRQVAKRGIGYLMRYPVFGIGIDNFGMAEGTISDYAQQVAHTNVGIKWSAPHNSWVEAGAETGFVGLGIWAALLVGSAGGLLRLRRKMPPEWATSSDPDARFLYLATLYIPIAFVGFLVSATFVSFAWSDQSYILPALAMGVQIAYQQKIRTLGSPSGPPSRARPRRGLRPAQLRPT